MIKRLGCVGIGVLLAVGVLAGPASAKQPAPGAAGPVTTRYFDRCEVPSLSYCAFYFAATEGTFEVEDISVEGGQLVASGTVTDVRRTSYGFEGEVVVEQGDPFEVTLPVVGVSGDCASLTLEFGYDVVPEEWGESADPVTVSAAGSPDRCKALERFRAGKLQPAAAALDKVLRGH